MFASVSVHQSKMTLDRFYHQQTSTKELFTYTQLLLSAKYDSEKDAYLIFDIGTHYSLILPTATVISVASTPTSGWTCLINNKPQQLIGYTLREGDKLSFLKSKTITEQTLLIVLLLKVPVYNI